MQRFTAPAVLDAVFHAVLILGASLAALPAAAQSQPVQPAAAAVGPTAAPSAAANAEVPWPRSVKAGDATLLVFAPQLDSWDGARLAGRAAVQVELGTNPPQTRYGVVAFEARTLTDKARRLVTLDALRITKLDFPSSSAAQVQAWSAAIARNLGSGSRAIALDRLEAALAVQQNRAPEQRQPLRNEAPRVLFSSVPSILVTVDGAPRFAPMRNTPFERVLNTRPLLLRDASGTYYLKVFDGWMSATALEGPWRVLHAPSSELGRAFKAAMDAHLVDPLTGQSTPDRPAPRLDGQTPMIFVATAPTELIVTDGTARPVPVDGAPLLYVENTTGNVFMDMQDNLTYVLIAGRWFRSTSTAGPWQFVPANALPPAFAKIPDDSPKENVKASVAGTTQAREASIAASVPQTAAVKVAGTQLPAPRIDGEPRWKPIPGTSLAYVENTPGAILRQGDAFYAVENGVWFVAASVRGPWAVARSVPAEIYAIPPSSPLYYVTYVRIYDSTPDTVYVGYSPGYTGSIVDPVSGVVVYGTGYVYDPWIGTVWYGPPVTYGYGAAVAYTPWTGWAVAFGLGWAWGASTVATGWGWGPYPYWGAWAGPVWGGAAFGPRGGAVAWGPGGWAGYTGNVYSQWGNRATVSRAAGGYNAWTGNAWAGQVGASYNSRTGVASAGQRGAIGNAYTGNYAAGERGAAVGPGGSAAVGSRGTAGNAYTGNPVSGGRGAVYNANTGQTTTYGRATGAGGGTVAHVGDDMYAGKDGNVYRNTGDGWQKATPEGWQGGGPQGGGDAAARAQATRGADGGLGAQLDSDRSARDFGGQRAGALQQSSMGMERSFGGGEFHGGGGFAGGGGGFRGGGFGGGGGFRGRR